MKPFAIFRPGIHTDANGKTITFTQQHIDDMIAAYDPAVHQAPIVIGHPESNAPAFGWISSLGLAGGHVVATPDQLNTEFEEMVRTGAFKQRSASLYTPGSPANPKPEGYYLRHVGFLGAAPPAIKGMPAVAFSDASDEGVIEFVDAQYTTGMIARILRGLRDWFIEKEGREVADDIIPDFAVAELDAEARQPDPGPAPEAVQPAPFTEPMSGDRPMTDKTPEQIKAETDALQADQDALKTAREQLEADRAEFAELQRKARSDRIGARLDTLTALGKITPAQKTGFQALLLAIPEGPVEFGETDKPDKRDPVDFIVEFLQGGSAGVNTGEITGDDGRRTDDGARTAEQAAVNLAEKAKAYQTQRAAEGVDVSWTDAVVHVAKEAAAA